MRKKNIIALGLGLFVLCVGIYLITVLYGPNDQPSRQIYAGKISIGYSPWPGYVGLFIARDKGYFAEEGLDVELRGYPGLADVSKDYLAGKIQGKANLTFEAVNESLQDFQQQVVLIIDYSNGSDGIIAQPSITNFGQINGKKVAYEFGTLEEFFLAHALAEYNLNLSNIKGVNLNPEAAAEAVIKKEADVAVTFEPFMSSALAASGGNLIYDSSQAPAVITDILTFNQQFIDENPETIAALVRAYFRAIDFLQSHPDESHQILANAYGIQPKEAKQQLMGVKMLTLTDNQSAFTYSAGPQSLYVNMQRIVHFVSGLKGSEQDLIDPEVLINPKFVREIDY